MLGETFKKQNKTITYIAYVAFIVVVVVVVIVTYMQPIELLGEF